jgi:hypothetical protein
MQAKRFRSVKGGSCSSNVRFLDPAFTSAPRQRLGNAPPGNSPSSFHFYALRKSPKGKKITWGPTQHLQRSKMKLLINPTKGGAEGKSFHLGHARSGAVRREYVSIEVEHGC